MSFKDKIDKIFHKKKSDEEFINDELPDDTGEINFEDTSPEEEAKTLQKKKIMLAGGVVLVVAIAAVVSNAMTDKKVQQERPLSSASMVASPAQALPDKYSDISKYQEQTKQDEMKQRKDEIRGKSDTRNVKTNNTAQRQQQTQSSSGGSERVVYVDRPSSNSGSNVIDRQAEKERAEEEERKQAMISSSLAFNIASDMASGKSVKQAIDDNINASDTSSSYVASSGSYTLNAGTIIPATLLTGITSDVPNGDVVAQIRQDVYDSLTGTHLLIPQGSRLIGTSGSAGSRGNKRIGVIFTRIILPSGVSIILPDQKAIDGVGYPGLEDEYTEHKGAAYGSAFMAALLGAAAQSTTGDTSGDDERSPGQEAVAGAVAEILRTGEKFVDRELEKQPTITINPGFQFSVFINQDLNLGEYGEYNDF